MDDDIYDFVQKHLSFFQIEAWYSVLNLIQFLRDEFTEGSLDQQVFERDINEVLEREKIRLSLHCR